MGLSTHLHLHLLRQVHRQQEIPSRQRPMAPLLGYLLLKMTSFPANVSIQRIREMYCLVQGLCSIHYLRRGRNKPSPSQMILIVLQCFNVPGTDVICLSKAMKTGSRIYIRITSTPRWSSDAPFKQRAARRLLAPILWIICK